MRALLQAFIQAIQQLFAKRSVAPVSVRTETVAVTAPPLPVAEPTVVAPPPVQSKAFLICPIHGNDKNGIPLTPRTVKIVSVVDHSGTAIDPVGPKKWGINAKNKKVIAFNGEVGDGESCTSPPLGYTKSTPSAFFSSGEINYVGCYDPNDKHPATHYLNYDGHAGYDFGYPKMTLVLATASGTLHKATDVEDSAVYGQGWDALHTFYIKHENGFSTWYRHCEKLKDELETQIGQDKNKSCVVNQGDVVAYVGKFGTPAVHLHLEVRNESGEIVDPYGDKLWLE